MNDEKRITSYLIPANSKKSQLKLGLFTWTDIIILIVGCTWSFLMWLIITDVSLSILVLMGLPALISAFLVMPVPHYHNVLQLLTNIFNFYTNRRQYYWKGWEVYERFNTSDK